MTSLLDEALDAWADARRGVVAELKRVPPSQLHFRPEPRARSAAEIVLHVVDTGLMWTGELTNPGGDFTRKSFQAFLREYGTPASSRPRDKTGFLRLLRNAHAISVRRIQDARPEQYFQPAKYRSTSLLSMAEV